MAQKSKIEWTESTWNPVTGCTKVSPGCANCYAEVLAKRIKAMGNPSYKNGFEVTLHERMLHHPLKWRKPQIVFVNSMSDLFHESVPVKFIKRIFNIMENAMQHQFQILTKRSERMLELNPDLQWQSNMWMGVSVENADFLYRIEHLVRTDARIKFLSLEPFLGPIPELPLDGIDWVIVGGESGSKARPMDPEWVMEIRDQCLNANVPFFFKQWGGFRKKRNGRELEGRTWDEMPVTTSSLH